MKQIFFISLLLVCSLFSFSQDSYTTLDGKTVSGTVENYKEWSKNPTTALFKQNNGKEITLTPDNCKDFTAGSDYFTSYNGTRILNSTDILSNELKSDKMVKDSVHVFLRRIYRLNNYAVYKLYDNKRINFYFSSDGNIEELEYYETLTNNAAEPFNGYKDYLLQQFSGKGIKNLQGKINDLDYKENDLLDFFSYVFGDKLNTSEKLRNKYASEFLLGAGLNESFGKLETTDGANSFRGNSFAPSLEIGLRIYSQRNFGKLFFQPTITLMPLYSSFRQNTFKTQATLVNANLGIGYMFVKKEHFSFYVDGAGGLTLLFGYQTKEDYRGGFVKSKGADNRMTVHPEIGVLLSKKLNIAFSEMLAMKMPFWANMAFDYKVSQTSLSIRYAFVQKKKK